ncbi:MAG: alpha/beta hydrolase [Anaerolineae bacterium]|nr:alpha/beta hydrolase [Anaerolineae bacterium]
MPAIDPTARQFMTIDGYKIAYLVVGNPTNPPLVLVHGWLSHAGFWKPTLEAFQDTHYCVAVDLLGHGLSDKPHDGDYSISAQARRVLAVADGLGVKRFTWIGHSMGGQIGLYTAINHPERLDQLVSVAGVVTGKLSAYVRYVMKPVFWLGSLFPPMWNASRWATRWRWYTDLFDRPIIYDVRHNHIDPIDRQMAIQPGVEISMYRDLEAIAACDLTGDLSKIRTPTLVIFGKQDNTVPVEHGYLVKQYVKGSQLVLLDKCGHVPMTEKRLAYLEALKTFLHERVFAG